MNCPNCGASVEANDLFCTSCGTRMTQPEPQPAPQPAAETAAPATEAQQTNNAQPKDMTPMLKNIVKFGAIAVVAVVLIILLVKIFSSGSDYIFLEKNVLPVPVDEEVRFVVDDKMGEAKVDGKISDYINNPAGDLLVFTTVEETVIENSGSDDDSLWDDGWYEPDVERTYTLYWTDGEELTKIADDCDEAFELSSDGTGVLYIDADGSLVLYNIEKNEGTTVCNSSDNKNIYGLQISPDGDSAAYQVTEFTEEGEAKNTIYFFDGETSEKVTSDGYVLAMSNDGDQIYVVATNDDGVDKLSVYKGASGDKVSLGQYSNVVAFNSDMTQIMYTDGEKTYASCDGEESFKVSSKSGFDLIIPENCVGIGSIFGKVYESDNALYLIEKEEEPVKLASRVYNVTMDASGEYLYYIKSDDETLFRIEIADGDKAADNAVSIADDVDGYVVSSDCKYVYYSSDDTLYSVDGRDGDDKTSIAEDVYDAEIDGDDVFYYICDEELYTCTKGEKYGKLKSDIVALNKVGKYVYAFNEDELNVCLGKKDIEKLSDINLG